MEGNITDNKEIINCPACGKEMKKLFIKESGLNLDICLDGCGGIYFDNRELEKFDEQNENIDEILNAIKGKSFVSVDETKTRYCPLCYDMPMTKMGAANGNIEIDVCQNCGGKFLDLGELNKIRSSETSKIENINFVKEFLAIEQEDLKTLNKFKDFLNKYYDIVPWH